MKSPVSRGKRIRGAIGSCVFAIVILLIFGYALLWKFAPDVAGMIFPYRAYTIVTGSMEPTIPTGSAVLVKSVRPGQELVPGTVITFRANRFGEEIVLTHYLDSVETYQGAPRYRTHAEGTDYKDDYVTRREDILGTYVTHLPKAGKLLLFLQSPFGLGLLGMAALTVIIAKAAIHYTEGGGKSSVKGVRFENLEFKSSPGKCTLTGEMRNTSSETIVGLKARITLYNANREEIFSEVQEFISPDHQLEPRYSQLFVYSARTEAHRFEIAVVEIACACSGPALTGASLKGRDRQKVAEEQTANFPAAIR